jgi:predicted DNA binding CopG/RHH family protein
MSTAASGDAELNKELANMNVEIPRELLKKVKASAALDELTLRDFVTVVLETVVAEDRRFRLPRARAS